MNQDKIDLINERILSLEFAISDAQSKADADLNSSKYQGYIDLVVQYTNIKNAFEQEKITLTSQV